MENNPRCEEMINHFVTLNLEDVEAAEGPPNNATRMAYANICKMIQKEEEISEDNKNLENYPPDIRKAMIFLLSNRINQDIRSKSVPKSTATINKELKKWLQRSNLERSFVFYSRQFLEEQIKARGIKLKAANKKIDTMIEELAKFEKNGNDQGTTARRRSCAYRSR